MLDQSDVISFHNYGQLPDIRLASRAAAVRPADAVHRIHGPRRGSTFDPILGYLKQQHIGAYNWGFVAGKTQTIYPWDSWKKPYPAEPALWFHDIFHADGKPYDRPRSTTSGARPGGSQIGERGVAESSEILLYRRATR